MYRIQKDKVSLFTVEELYVFLQKTQDIDIEYEIL